MIMGEKKDAYINREIQSWCQRAKYGLEYEVFQKYDSDKTLRRKFLLRDQLTSSRVKGQHPNKYWIL